MYYGYFLPDTQEWDIVETWGECQDKTKGKYAQIKKFKTKEETEQWLKFQIGEDSIIDSQSIKENAIYFDANGGMNNQMEVYVTNYLGETVLFDFVPDRVDEKGSYLLKEGRTYNFGKLTGLYLALKYAFEHDIKYIYGNSNVVLNHWSLGTYKRSNLDADTIKLIERTFKLRQKFQNLGCTVGFIKDNINPARKESHR